jgi:hypothetical protein
MIYITGDTHRDIDIGKVFIFMNGKSYNITIKNYIIITGDFGIPWYDNDPILPSKGRKADEKLLDKINTQAIKYNFDILFVDGNHENFNALYEYPKIDKFDSQVRELRSNIFHLMRGEIYNIEDNKIFTFGGAASIDKQDRILGVSWWEQEQPTYIEYNQALYNLLKYNNTIDYIISHTAPHEIINTLGFPTSEKHNDVVSTFLSHLTTILNFKKWYFGHFHKDEVIDNKFFAMYKKIRAI